MISKESNGKYAYLIKNVGILTVCNFSSKILVFFLVPLYTSILTTQEYGIYDLAISTTQIFFFILTLNITDGVLRFLLDHNADRSGIITTGFKYIFISSCLMAFMLWLNYIFRIWQDINGLELLVFLYFLSYTLNQFFIQVAKGIDKIRIMGIAGVLGTLSMVGFNIIFLIVFKMRLKGFFFATILGQFIPVIYFFISLKIWKFVKVKVPKTLQIKMVLYSIPLIFNSLGWMVNGAADKYIVSFIFGTAANGVLSVAYKLPTILNTFQTIFNQAWQVSAVREYEGNETKIFYQNTLGILNAIMCVLCTGLICFNKPIAKILFAKDFYDAWIYAPFLLISNVMNTASGFCGSILTTLKKPQMVAKAAIYGSIVNIFLNIILVYCIGIQGATIATMLSSLVIFLIRKKACKELVVGDDYWRIPVTWGMLIVQATCEIFNLTAISIIMGIFIILINLKQFIVLVKK